MGKGFVKMITTVNGTVEAVRAELGVATDDYNDLKNKPSINGVKLHGNMNLETLKAMEPAGPSVYILEENIGNAISFVPEEKNIFTYTRDFQLGDLIITKDKKLFCIDELEITGSSDPADEGRLIYHANLFLDLN